MAQASSSKMISFKTADGDFFEVEPSIAKEMQTVQNLFDADADTVSASAIPLPKVSTREFTRIIDYCKNHRAAGKAKDSDDEFTKALSNEELMELLLAANYLGMKDLIEFLSQCIADRIANKSVEVVRKLFRFTDSGYTPEEEAKKREENAWTFKGVDADDE
ncbi:SKP1-like protein 14 [Lotus japonicus]|uniref:SKP1-like protein 14 n=1 Tax=Lotus japonicus TaxID=34305 RepID=UPI00258A1B9B|nr:SKP1-like protein 14 [Lotus japonicus]